MLRRAHHLLSIATVAAAGAALIAGCAGTGAAGSGKLQVVAAENFWGSIAAQLGGDRASVRSIVRNPAADPHDYEPSAADARAMAAAKLAIVNGIGYDPWAPKLLGANPLSGRIVLNVGDLVGIEAGGNPHRWYSPRDVRQVIDAIVADYVKLDPQDAAYFRRRKATFEQRGLARYNGLIASIKRNYSGVPVGASESIFEPLAGALGLKLITPPGFLNAISEGSEPTAADRATVDSQIRSHRIKVWIYNSQNSTPDVQRLTQEARAAGIPVATVTETLSPASASFQEWQSRQLAGISRALASTR
jgi:zinc/manganese transport system substrate-binding protein